MSSMCSRHASKPKRPEKLPARIAGHHATKKKIDLKTRYEEKERKGEGEMEGRRGGGCRRKTDLKTIYKEDERKGEGKIKGRRGEGGRRRPPRLGFSIGGGGEWGLSRREEEGEQRQRRRFQAWLAMPPSSQKDELGRTLQDSPYWTITKTQEQILRIPPAPAPLLEPPLLSAEAITTKSFSTIVVHTGSGGRKSTTEEPHLLSSKTNNGNPGRSVKRVAASLPSTHPDPATISLATADRSSSSLETVTVSANHQSPPPAPRVILQRVSPTLPQRDTKHVENPSAQPFSS